MITAAHVFLLLVVTLSAAIGFAPGLPDQQLGVIPPPPTDRSPSTSAKHIAIVTDEGPSAAYKDAFQRKSCYAAMHGYSLLRGPWDSSYFKDWRTFLDNVSDGSQVSSAGYWTKYNALNSTLARSEHEWLAWMDSDAVILDLGKPLEDFIPQDDATQLVIMDQEWQTNNGVFLIRNSDWSRQFMKDWLECGSRGHQTMPWGDQFPFMGAELMSLSREKNTTGENWFDDYCKQQPYPWTKDKPPFQHYTDKFQHYRIQMGVGSPPGTGAKRISKHIMFLRLSETAADKEHYDLNNDCRLYRLGDFILHGAGGDWSCASTVITKLQMRLKTPKEDALQKIRPMGDCPVQLSIEPEQRNTMMRRAPSTPEHIIVKADGGIK